MKKLTLNEAREKVVVHMLFNMEQERAEDLFADHVTEEMKEEHFKKRAEYIEEVGKGEHDNNVTVAQLILFYMTGETIQLLP